MNRIDQTFTKLRHDKKKAFVAYITAGDPSPEKTPELVFALEKAGVDIVELGVPFSDPLADGIVNQMAADRALKAGTTVPRILQMIREIRKKSSVPLVLFTYLNPIYAYGLEKFYHDASEAGADGVLILDLPPEEALLSQAKSPENFSHIWLISPTTPPQRVQALCQLSSGFIYYVSREGVTGMQKTVASSIPEQLVRIREHTSVPVCVGFGVSDPDQAQQVASIGDGVVIGSAIVKKIEEWNSHSDLPQKLESFVKPFSIAIRSLTS
jgi:tryptophan synthase alpha chain